MIWNLNPVLIILIGIATAAIAQIILKKGSVFAPLSIKWFSLLFFSLLTYSISFLSYYFALRYFDISKISPIMMTGTVSLVVAYGFLMGEDFNFLKILGIILAVISIVVILKS